MLHDLLFRIRGLVRRSAMEEELADEIRFHIEHETDKLIAAGVAPEEAARRARIAFGATQATVEECREARGTRWLEETVQDVAYGLRMLRSSPAFTAVAVASLALGIGANTSMFQLLDAVRLRTLPVRSPKQLQFVRIDGEARSGTFTSRHSHASFAQWEQIRDHQQVYSATAAFSPRPVNLASGGEVRPAQAMLVSGTFFDTLGVPAMQGRVFNAGDDTPGCGAPVAVISHAFWRREFNGDPGAVGRSLSMDGHTFTISGITPPGFFGIEVGRFYDVALPLCSEELLKGHDNSQVSTRRDNYWLVVMGRLKPGVGEQQAQAQLSAISADVFRGSAPADRDAESLKGYLSLKLRAEPAAYGLSWLRVSYERALWLLLGSATLVLLVACANLANLLLARASARVHEFSVRVALGASRSRIVRQLLTESLLLAILGAVSGLGVAAVANRWLISLLVTNDEPVVLATNLDWRVLAFSAGVAMVTCLLFGLAPAVQCARTRAGAAGNERTLTVSRGHARFRNALVVAQVALSVVLIAGAALFGHSLVKLINAETGFRSDNVLITSLDTRRLDLNEARQKVMFDELLRSVRAARGVTAAASAMVIPMSGWNSNTSWRDNGQEVITAFNRISPGFFETMGTPILAGRDFGAEDEDPALCSVIVNEAVAKRVYGGANPVGRSFGSPFDEGKLCRIVGYVPNTKYVELREKFQPILYFPNSQIFMGGNYLRLLVRSSLPPGDLTRSLREAVGAVSPSIDIEFLRLDTELKESIAKERATAALAGGFGVLAGILAAVGLYGVLAYSVAMRRREIGIRLALGADRRRVVRMVLGEAGLLLGSGAMAGTVLTLLATPAARSMLYGLEPNDPWTIASAVSVLVLLGLAAGYLPARRAARLDPMLALREE